jgi:hypothetical protein
MDSFFVYAGPIITITVLEADCTGLRIDTTCQGEFDGFNIAGDRATITISVLNAAGMPDTSATGIVEYELVGLAHFEGTPPGSLVSGSTYAYDLMASDAGQFKFNIIYDAPPSMNAHGSAVVSAHYTHSTSMEYLSDTNRMTVVQAVPTAALVADGAYLCHYGCQSKQCACAIGTCVPGNVSADNGAEVLSVVDLRVRCERGFDFVWSRNYASNANGFARMGWNWQNPYFEKLRVHLTNPAEAGIFQYHVQHFMSGRVEKYLTSSAELLQSTATTFIKLIDQAEG